MSLLQYQGATALAYVTEETPGARHLLVVFPRSIPNATPQVALRPYFAHLNAHRVYLSADEFLYMGPGRERAGARTAADLISAVAADLGVAGENIVAFGTSFRAVCAMYIGLLAKAGWIVVGGPPVRFGGHVDRLERVLAPTPEVRARRQVLAQLTGVDGQDDARAFYDELIVRAAREADHEAWIGMLASPQDPTHRDALWLADQLEDHPTLTVSVTMEDYGRHADVAPAFLSYLDRVLVPVTGRVSQPPGVEDGTD